jgi:hypothetical protein
MIRLYLKMFRGESASQVTTRGFTFALAGNRSQSIRENPPQLVIEFQPYDRYGGHESSPSGELVVPQDIYHYLGTVDN